MAHEAPRGINGGDRGVLPIFGREEEGNGQEAGRRDLGNSMRASARGERGGEGGVDGFNAVGEAATGAAQRGRRARGDDGAGPSDGDLTVRHSGWRGCADAVGF